MILGKDQPIYNRQSSYSYYYSYETLNESGLYISRQSSSGTAQTIIDGVDLPFLVDDSGKYFHLDFVVVRYLGRPKNGNWSRDGPLESFDGIATGCSSGVCAMIDGSDLSDCEMALPWIGIIDDASSATVPSFPSSSIGSKGLLYSSM